MAFPEDLLPGEVLKPVPGFEGYHSVTNFGRVWSYPRTVFGATMGKPTSWTQPGRWRSTVGGKYATVVLRDDKGNRRQACVHVLVAEVFLPPPRADQDCVNHKDLNKRNNRSYNLEWCTAAEDTEHARANGAYKRQSSKYRGVSRRPSGVWCAYAIINKKPKEIGYFKTETEAARVYADFAEKNGLVPQRKIPPFDK